MVDSQGSDPAKEPNVVVSTDGTNFYAKDKSGSVLYSGANATVVMNSAFKNPNTVMFIDKGNYPMSDWLRLPQDGTLYGAGLATVLDFGTTKTGINVSYSNAEVGNLKVIGGGSVGVFADHVTVHDITATTTTNPGSFFVYANRKTVNDVKIINCIAAGSATFGFFVSGEGSPSVVSNLSLLSCKAVDCGRQSQSNEWITGFDFCEYGGLTIENMVAQDCYAGGSWESGFHFENAPTKINCKLVNCVSENNGQKPSHTFGAGFCVSSGVSMLNCRSSGNLGAGTLAHLMTSAPVTITGYSDDSSNGGLYVAQSSPQGTGAVLSDITLSNSQSMGISLAGDNIQTSNVKVINPKGNASSFICNSFKNLTNSRISIDTVGGTQYIINYLLNNRDSTFSGSAVTSDDGKRNFYVAGGTNVTLDGLSVVGHGPKTIGIYGDRNPTNCVVKNTRIADESGSPNLGNGIYGGAGSLIVDSASVTTVGVTNPCTNCMHLKPA